MRGAILPLPPTRFNGVVLNYVQDTSPWCGTELRTTTTLAFFFNSSFGNEKCGRTNRLDLPIMSSCYAFPASKATKVPSVTHRT
jgi:hypothetical protein